MQRAILRFSNLAVSLGITGLFAIGYPADVRAQTIFCPTTLPLTNGSCTNGVDGAFSGAALASQALSEVAETTTQVTGKAVVERREQERRRRPVREPARAIPPEKPKPTAVPPEKPKPTAVGRKEPPPPLLPLPIEPAVRFGTWTQVFGDYQKRDASGPGVLTCCLSAGPSGGGDAAVTALGTLKGLGGGGGAPFNQGLALNIDSRASTVGFVAGADFTSRALFSPSDGFIGGPDGGLSRHAV